MKCAEAREALPAYVREAPVNLALRRHLSRCTECRAELVRYQRLLGSLADLAERPLEAPPGLYTSLVRIPREAALTAVMRRRADVMAGHLARNRGAYLGGVGVALAGAAAALWRLRARHVATA
jgi:predicted anti-sigma-YlaC factor YlaD